MACVSSGRSDSPGSDNFNPQHPKYQCCFQMLQAKKGSMLIALFHIAITMLILVCVVKSLQSPNKSALEAVFQIIVIFVVLTANLIFLIGLRIEQRHLVSFFLTFHILKIAVLFIIFLFLILGYKAYIFHDEFPPGAHVPLEYELYIVLQIFISLAVVFIEVWFLTIFLKSFRYLTDKNRFVGSDSVVEL